MTLTAPIEEGLLMATLVERAKQALSSSDVVEMIDEELHHSYHIGRITDAESSETRSFVQRTSEIKMALEEALEDYESNVADDGELDESGLSVPGWVILAREVLK